VKHKLKTDRLSGVRVAVQGLGNVGMNLCRLLHEAGARLTVTDVIFDHVRLASERFGAQALAPDAIVDAEVDLFAPCALGAVINARTVGRLKVAIVAGGANNQLARPEDGSALHERGILYAPDCVVNAGGMIQLAAERLGEAPAVVEARVRGIAARLGEVFLQSEREDKPPHIVADQLAEQRFRPGALAA
jgi:leucine dehydrogenase